MNNRRMHNKMTLKGLCVSPLFSYVSLMLITHTGRGDMSQR